MTYTRNCSILDLTERKGSEAGGEGVPRPMKCRKVCQMPRTREFHPAGGSPRKEAVVLTVDEYEAVRLIDRQGFSQEECSAYMQVARSTVQSIYNSARKKLAEALVDGRSLRIEGGNYQLCDGSEVYCRSEERRGLLRLRRLPAAPSGLYGSDRARRM